MKELPDTSKWQPRKDATETLRAIFYKRCQQIESLIIAKAKQEQELNIDNFDSGSGVEDIIRSEFSKLLPDRYYVTKGVINDRNGLTSGDQDIIIFNKIWFPTLKAGATEESRRFHFPIEGVYSIGEVKQTLTIDNLDDAMRKLVICKRLKRPKTGKNRIVENRELNGYEQGFTNPLYTFIITTNLDDNLSMEDISRRFHEINKTLKRDEIINSLCILKKGAIFWSYFDKKTIEWRPAMFYDFTRDLSEPILPILVQADEERKNSFYSFMINLNTHLNTTILGSEDLAIAYGDHYDAIQFPPLDEFLINPK
jgi:hypothetical protein